MSYENNGCFDRSRDKNKSIILQCQYDGGNKKQKRKSHKKIRDRNKNEKVLGCYKETIKVKQRGNVNLNVEDPQQFVISHSCFLKDKNMAKFSIDFKVENKAQNKKMTKADELKSMISPIQKIWGSIVKQYLNDSEFVEIYRKNKGLHNENIRYGKSIIDYYEGEIDLLPNLQFKQQPIFSRAYFKLWEILNLGIFDGKQKDDVIIGSLAEGPGGFIHSLIDYRLKRGKINDEFYAITLLINENTRNSKDWSDQRGLKYFNRKRQQGYKIKTSYGKTGTGNLLQQQNMDYFSNNDLNGCKCFLVTGDGGIECIADNEYDYQQLFNAKLFFAEIITALKIQQIGGKFILKIYDVAFSITKQLILLLCVYYGKVRLIKPVTSRPGNSQKYLLCQDFQGISQNQELQLKSLLKQWMDAQPNVSYFENKVFVSNILNFENLGDKGQIIERIQRINDHFIGEQVQKLEKGLKLVQDNNNDVNSIQEQLREKRFDQQIIYAYNWCKKYGIGCKDVRIVNLIE